MYLIVFIMLVFVYFDRSHVKDNDLCTNVVANKGNVCYVIINPEGNICEIL
jgi:hypothetical protein